MKRFCLILGLAGLTVLAAVAFTRGVATVFAQDGEPAADQPNDGEKPMKPRTMPEPDPEHLPGPGKARPAVRLPENNDYYKDTEARQVLDKVFETLGGVEKIKSVQNFTTKMSGKTYENGQEFPVRINRYQKPGMVRVERQFQTYTTAVVFNGKTSFSTVTSPGDKERQIPGNIHSESLVSASAQSLGHQELLDILARGAHVQYLGRKQNERDRVYYVFTMTFHGIRNDYFFNEQYLLAKRIMLQQGQLIENVYWAYKEIDGIKYPTRNIRKVNRVKTFEASSIQVDHQPLPLELFEQPPAYRDIDDIDLRHLEKETAE